MLRQIRLLSGLQLCNLFGINEIRYTTDSKKRNRSLLLASLWVLLIGMMIYYLGWFSKVLAKFGMGELIPIYFYTISAAIIMFFTFFKASSIIFQMKTYELLASIPVTRGAIVVSRFITMYVTNLMLSVVMMVPGLGIYAYYLKPDASFYVAGLIGTFFLPLLPITLATIVGAAITAISSRMKHKNLVSSILSILLVVMFMVGSMFLPSEEAMTEEMLIDITGTITDKIEKIYAPAAWFEYACIDGDWGKLAVLVAIPVVIFAAMIALLQKYFMGICSALNATSARNNYKMQSLKTSSVVKALYKKEIKRYFASAVYVSNTMIGYIILAACGIGLFAVGPEKLGTILGLPGVVQKLYPFVLALMISIMPITSASISMEGKNWWLTKSLPLRTKDVVDGKLIANFIIVIPFYVICEVFSCIALRNSPLECLWTILLPLVFVVFSAVTGMLVNLLLPVMNWDTEVRAIKQSASTMITMLVGFACNALPIFIIFKFPEISINLVYFILIIAVCIASVIIYKKSIKFNLMDIEG